MTRIGLASAGRETPPTPRPGTRIDAELAAAAEASVSDVVRPGSTPSWLPLRKQRQRRRSPRREARIDCRSESVAAGRVTQQVPMQRRAPPGKASARLCLELADAQDDVQASRGSDAGCCLAA